MASVETRFIPAKTKSKMRKGEVAITAEMAEDLWWPRIRVLGIDPSISSTGWSVVDFFPRQRPRLLGHGTIHTDPPGDGQKTNMKNIILRSRIIFDAMRGVVEAWPVDVVVIELPIPARGRGPGHMGPSSQSGSMVACAVYSAMPYSDVDIDLADLNHIKLLVTTDGFADKQKVKAGVTEWLGTLPRTNTDVSDSIAGTIAHALEHLTEPI